MFLHIRKTKAQINCVVTQARRHVFESGPAEVRASAEDKSGGEHEKGYSPSRKGGSGDLPTRNFLIYGCLYVRF